MTDELTKLSIKYGTDRHPGSKHSYTPYYYNLFKNKRKSIKKILEIGVGEGSGIRMWRDFFPNATIYGADNSQERVFKETRIKVFLCDQSSKEDLDNLIDRIGSDIDIVIDDGSHKPSDQVFTCKTLMPLLNKHIIYIIEDVFDLTIIKNLADYEIEVPRLMRWRARYDDWLVIVKPSKYD